MWKFVSQCLIKHQFLEKYGEWTYFKLYELILILDRSELPASHSVCFNLGKELLAFIV
jgi:hypothetical protein